MGIILQRLSNKRMAFYGYQDNVGECHWTPYTSSAYDLYAVLPSQSPLAYSSYEFNEPRSTEYSPYSYFDSYSPIQSVQNYYAFNLSEPRLIQYDPPPCYAVSSFYSQINYRTSYSSLEINVPEFEEYDPTPYGGGYDQIETYGKPLPPSDEICYPPSSLQPKPDGELLGGFSYGSIPAAYGEKNEQPVKPDSKSKPVDTKEQDSLGEKIVEGTDNGGNGSPRKPSMEEERGGVDEHPSSDYVGTGGYGYEWNRQGPYCPYGSGLESLDLCESIFGYWPCLTKMEQQSKVKCSQVGDDEESRYDPWQSTADYLFGSPFVYGELQNGGSGSSYPHQNFYTQY